MAGRQFPQANIVAVDYDPGASEVNQLNRIKLMMAVAFENMKKDEMYDAIKPETSIKAIKNDIQDEHSVKAK